MAIEKPTILQILPEMVSGGVERGTIEVAEALVTHGYRALVASAGGPLVDQLKRVGGEHITLPLQTKNPLQIWKNSQHLIEVIRTAGVDIVHARSRAPAWSAYRAAKQTQTPFVTTFHGFYGLQSSLKKRYNRVMTYGEPVIAVSNYIRDHIVAQYGLQTSQVQVIHRGADVRKFRPDRVSGQRVMQLLEQWHLPEEQLHHVPVILMPGRLTRWKGQHVLIKALGSIPHRNFFCLIVGEMEKHSGYAAELEKLIEQENLVGHVRLTGPTPHMVDVYSMADLVICPSIEPEAFGRVPVEAQAMGKPVIATDHGGACETVIPEQTGWLVPPNDSISLANTIEYALSRTPEQREHMAHIAIEHVRHNFSTEAMCNRVLDVYYEILHGQNGYAHAA